MTQPVQVPQLRFHSPSKQFYVYLGRAKGRFYFGRDGAQAERDYKLWKSRFLLAQSGQAPALQAGDPTITVTEAVIAFLRYAENYYRDSRAINRIQHSMNVVMDEFGSLPVHEFRSRALKHVQQKILIRPILWKNKCTAKPSTISRVYANRMLVDILHCWRWLVSEEIVPPDNLAAMEAVQLVHQGHGGRETGRVPPVDSEVFEANLVRRRALQRHLRTVRLYQEQNRSSSYRSERLTIGTIDRARVQPSFRVRLKRSTTAMLPV